VERPEESHHDRCDVLSCLDGQVFIVVEEEESIELDYANDDDEFLLPEE